MGFNSGFKGLTSLTVVNSVVCYIRKKCYRNKYIKMRVLKKGLIYFSAT